MHGDDCVLSNIIINRNRTRTCNRCLTYTSGLVEQMVNVALTYCVFAYIARWDDIITRILSQSADKHKQQTQSIDLNMIRQNVQMHHVTSCLDLVLNSLPGLKPYVTLHMNYNSWCGLVRNLQSELRLNSAYSTCFDTHWLYNIQQFDEELKVTQRYPTNSQF